ncbi:nitrate reductase subunit alpha [Demequina aurantiaca]|uniref:nitrate reductase subunit alpha n=1 Tax=Demequina aurantiaca TaxID=676200 RepID=UPI000780201E|nr:nitrate reductase subunit alpha [Demequina aurantiaca]
MTTVHESESPLASTFLVNAGRFLQRGDVSPDLRTVTHQGGRDADTFYRDRWSHDKIVRSTHGVNCTGSCSWKVYVKDGVITWETQQTDYPSVGADSPEYEPRGCPRGAAFSWYTYSPTRVKYPYIRGVLLEAYREAKKRFPDPVDAWASIVDDSKARMKYQKARGKGGLVRASWSEAKEIVAAAHVHTAKKYGPDRIFGFSPIPAMSMASHAAGSRFISLVGGSMLSFYDWYADLPVASPQVFGDQTDVPESADWFNSSYLIMWGANVPVTRTPDAHFMAEARYRGQKVVTVSPDYADNTKFADEWMSPHPGTDGALAMAMGHVMLKEFYVDRQVPRFVDYVKRYSDFPYLVTLKEKDGAWVPDKFVTAADLGDTSENAEFKTVLIDSATGRPHVPNGSLGHRFGDEGEGKWNLDLEGVDPALSLFEASGTETAELLLPRFDVEQSDGERGGVHHRGVPAARLETVGGERLVTTVYDLTLAQYGVGREGLPGEWPTGYDDLSPYTPAWQEEITGVPASMAERVGREFAQNAEDSGGRSMIILGAGTNHWFHSDETYRTFLSLITMTGCQGVNGGGWAHYVGQEKCRPVTGWATVANALDWTRPPRHMNTTAWSYVNTGQWRYDRLSPDALSSPLGENRFANKSTMGTLAQAARSGWMPSFPSLNANSLDLGDAIKASGQAPGEYMKEKLTSGEVNFAIEDPDAEENWPRVLTVWRANLVGSSAKGNEFFLHHLLGTDSSIRASELEEDERPEEVRWRESGQGKLDLLVSMDYRMTSTGLYSDILFPAATWYEKHDLSTTDMHPFIHAFTPAISPPWETKSDYDTFQEIARSFSELARGHLDTRHDLVTAPLLHDTPDAMALPSGVVKDWREGEVDIIPGKTAPKFIVVERDYTAVADKMSALGPLTEGLGLMTKGVKFDPTPEVELLGKINGVIPTGVAAGRPSLATSVHACETILALSGTTNGRMAVDGFRNQEKRTGQGMADLALDNEGKRITFADTQARPVPVITSPEWSGSEHGGRRYTAFAINVERLKPWHTLTGRQHFFLDHDWMSELGENLPTYRPPLNMHRISGDSKTGQGKEVTVRYLTPHSKWSIHSNYQDNQYMLSLSRGGPDIWMSVEDAEIIGVKDNEWIEAYNRNGVVVARAVVSHRMPAGTVYMYHAKDRLVDVPIAEESGKRGGIHNSLTRLVIKPTHLLGGYAQLSFAFNYYGPTGNQRDEVTVIRRRSQEVKYS